MIIITRQMFLSLKMASKVMMVSLSLKQKLSFLMIKMNYGLDLERANKNRDLILEKRIDPIRVTSIGLGNTNPIDDSN